MGDKYDSYDAAKERDLEDEAASHEMYAEEFLEKLGTNMSEMADVQERMEDEDNQKAAREKGRVSQQDAEG